LSRRRYPTRPLATARRNGGGGPNRTLGKGGLPPSSPSRQNPHSYRKLCSSDTASRHRAPAGRAVNGWWAQARNVSKKRKSPARESSYPGATQRHMRDHQTYVCSYHARNGWPFQQSATASARPRAVPFVCILVCTRADRTALPAATLPGSTGSASVAKTRPVHAECRVRLRAKPCAFHNGSRALTRPDDEQ
jgi:hypothetical protein